MFLPAYGALWFIGLHGYAASIAGLLLADVATLVLAWRRLARRGFFRHAAPPSTELGRRIADYGLRAQLGGIVTLLNLRLDFILLNVLAGPAVLGVYAIASKFAELLKIPPLALTYVLYPEIRAGGRRDCPLESQKASSQSRPPHGGVDCSALVRGHIPHPGALWIGLQGRDHPGAHHPLRTGPRGCRRSHHRVPLRDRAAGVELVGDGRWACRDRLARCPAHSAASGPPARRSPQPWRIRRARSRWSGSSGGSPVTAPQRGRGLPSPKPTRDEGFTGIPLRCKTS